MSRIQILNANAKDFALEIVSGDLPSGPHEDGRIVKKMNDSGEVVLYIWDADVANGGVGAAWVEFSNADEVEAISTSLAAVSSQHITDAASLVAKDEALSIAIEAEETARALAVETERTRAQNVEATLSQAIVDEAAAKKITHTRL